MWIYRPIIAANKFRNADRTGKTFFRPDRFSDKSGTAQRIGGTNRFPPNRRTSEQATRAFGFPPFVKSPRTAVLRRRKVSRRTHPRPKERLRPIAPGMRIGPQKFLFRPAVLLVSNRLPLGQRLHAENQRDRLSSPAFEPAGTDWLKTVPTPENETIIPCRSSR